MKQKEYRQKRRDQALSLMLLFTLSASAMLSDIHAYAAGTASVQMQEEAKCMGSSNDPPPSSQSNNPPETGSEDFHQTDFTAENSLNKPDLQDHNQSDVSDSSKAEDQSEEGTDETNSPPQKNDQNKTHLCEALSVDEVPDPKEPEDQNESAKDENGLNQKAMQLSGTSDLLDVVVDVPTHTLEPGTTLVLDQKSSKTDAYSSALDLLRQNKDMVSDNTLMLLFDIRLEKDGKQTEPKGKVHVQMSLDPSGFDASLDPASDLQLIHLQNGKAIPAASAALAELPDDSDRKDSKDESDQSVVFDFDTDSFSEYAFLAAKSTPDQVPEKPDKENSGKEDQNKDPNKDNPDQEDQTSANGDPDDESDPADQPVLSKDTDSVSDPVTGFDFVEHPKSSSCAASDPQDQQNSKNPAAKPEQTQSDPARESRASPANTYPLYAYAKITEKASSGPVSNSNYYGYSIGTTNAPDPIDALNTTYNAGSAEWNRYTHDPIAGWDGSIRQINALRPEKLAINYPASSTMPNWRDGTRNYTYDANGTKKKGTFTIVWNNMRAERGAGGFTLNSSGQNLSVSGDYAIWHYNGSVILYDKDPCQMQFYMKAYPDTSYTMVMSQTVTPYNAYLNSPQVRSEWLNTLPSTLQPGASAATLTNTTGFPMEVYRWFLDEACTQQADYNAKIPSGQTQKYYGKYVPAAPNGSSWTFSEQIVNAPESMMNTRFRFTLRVTDTRGIPYNGPLKSENPSAANGYSVDYYFTDQNGNYSFELSNGESFSVILPATYKFIITQNRASPWTIMKKQKIGSGSFTAPTYSNAYSGTANNTGEVVFLDYASGPVPSGVDPGSKRPDLALIAICAGGLSFFALSLIRQRRRSWPEA